VTTRPDGPVVLEQSRAPAEHDPSLSS